MKPLRASLRTLLPPSVAMLLILVAWESYSRIVLAAIPAGDRYLPAPSRVAHELSNNLEVMAPHIWQTLHEALLGFLLALIIGLGFATIIDLSPTLRSAIYPLLVVSQAVPVLSVAPLLVLWFGFEMLPKVLVVAIVCFFPIVVAGADGFRSADPELIKLFRTFGASKWTIFRYVRLPGGLPSLFSGIRIAIPYSVIGAIWGEYIGAQWGLGIFMKRAQNGSQVALVFATIFVIVVMSLALFLLASTIERIVIPWRFSSLRRWRLPQKRHQPDLRPNRSPKGYKPSHTLGGKRP